MKNISDIEFIKICRMIYSKFWEGKMNQINIYFGNDKLLCAKYENFSHLLGLQYYETILNLSQSNKRKDFFKWFIYSATKNKILFSSIIKKINTNWKLISNFTIFKNFRKAKDLIYVLQQKIRCFERFLNFLFDNSNEKFFALYNSNSNSKIEYFITFDNQKSQIGLKHISTINYTYNTYIPMSFQIRKINKNFNIVGNYKINKIQIK